MIATLILYITFNIVYNAVYAYKNMKENSMKYISLGICILSVTLAGCASPDPDFSQKSPGFLTDYTTLKQIKNTPDGQHIYVYTAPNVKRSDYHAVIVDPVLIYQTATESGVTEEQISRARVHIADSIKDVVKTKFPLTNTPGAGVARIQVAITGAVLEGDGFKPRYLIPVAAVIKLTTMVSGLDNKTPVLMVETKTTDSLNGKLLRSSVTIIRGEKFRQEVHTPQEFQAAAKIWVKEAITYANAPEKLKDFKE